MQGCFPQGNLFSSTTNDHKLPYAFDAKASVEQMRVSDDKFEDNFRQFSVKTYVVGTH